MTGKQMTDPALPVGMPDPVRHYLDHARAGLSLREIARREGMHASTVLRQIRRIESRRDDPLVDEALDLLACAARCGRPVQPQESDVMTAPVRAEQLLSDPETTDREARRILRRLTEPQARLAIAADMEKAAVLREFPDGQSKRTAVVDRTVAQAFALRDWIACHKPGRIALYTITAVGRAALRRMLESDSAVDGMAEAPQIFAGQHRIWGERLVPETAESGLRRVRYNVAESPVAALGRRRDKDGVPFLTPEQVVAGERLREDFELAHMGPRVAQNWDRFLTGGSRAEFGSGVGPAEGPRSARDRVAAALRDLGPGLGDMVLRCCCYLEGLETAEKRLGWSARSGKVVLRIALDRLRQHYCDRYGDTAPLIG